MDQQVTLLREFVEFAREVDRSKSVKTLHALVSKPKSLSAPIKTKLVEQARKCFTTVDFNNFQESDRFEFKTGFVSLGRLEGLCKGDDVDVFGDYMDCFRAAYEDDNKAVEQLLEELDIEADSPEAGFLKKIFNEIGQEFMDMVKSSQDSGDFDINMLLPRVATLFKNGKLMDLMGGFADSGVRMSKIMFAVGKLCKKYEDKEDEVNNNGEAAVESGQALGEDAD